MIRTGFIAAAALLAAAPAWAQTGSPPTTGNQQIPEKQSATPLGDNRNESLSNKLSKSGGVITPNSDIDPAIHKSAPDPQPNSTPVIPPSATGGNSAK